MVSDELEIIASLQQGVTAAVAASGTPSLPVSYLDVGFTEPADGMWLEIVHIPNNRQGDFWGDQKNHRGMLRLILHWPNNGAGIYSPLTVLGSIAGYFTKGRLLPNNGATVYEVPDFTGAVRNGDETLYPLTLMYMSFRN